MASMEKMALKALQHQALELRDRKVTQDLQDLLVHLAQLVLQDRRDPQEAVAVERRDQLDQPVQLAPLALKVTLELREPTEQMEPMVLRDQLEQQEQQVRQKLK
jgi:hypothetical protein